MWECSFNNFYFYSWKKKIHGNVNSTSRPFHSSQAAARMGSQPQCYAGQAVGGDGGGQADDDKVSKTASNLKTKMKTCSLKIKTKVRGAKSTRKKGRVTGTLGTVSSQLKIEDYFGSLMGGKGGKNSLGSSWNHIKLSWERTSLSVSCQNANMYVVTRIYTLINRN